MTYQDLCIYARDRIEFPRSIEPTQGEKDDIVRLIASKAEGIFMWLHVAITSINGVFSKDDRCKDISRKIDALCPTLARLYLDVLNRTSTTDRMNGASRASFFFKLANFKQRAKYDQGHRALGDKDATILETTLILDVADIERLSYEPALAFIKCENVETEVRCKCAGLLEVFSESPDTLAEEKRQFEAFECYGSNAAPLDIMIFAHRRLRFLHRTVYDFINDTQDGQIVLNGHTMSDEVLQVWILNSRLFLPAVFNLRYTYHHKNHKKRLFDGYHSALVLLNEMARLLEGQDRRPGEMDYEYYRILDLCGAHYNRARLFIPEEWVSLWGDRSRPQQFLLLAIKCGFDNYAAASIARGKRRNLNMSELLLYAAHSLCLIPSSGMPTRLNLIQALLQNGADPKYVAPLPVLSRTTRLMSTPFQEVLNRFTLDRGYGAPDPCLLTMVDATQLGKTLMALITAGADLNASILTGFEIQPGGDILALDMCRLSPSDRNLLSISIPAKMIIQSILTWLCNQFKPFAPHEDGGCCKIWMESLRRKIDSIDKPAGIPRFVALTDKQARHSIPFEGRVLKVSRADKKELAM